MTRDDAIFVMEYFKLHFAKREAVEAFDMAIKALSSSEKPNKWIDVEVLDKIRAEIDEQYDRVYPYDISCAEGLEMALGIIDKYREPTGTEEG